MGNYEKILGRDACETCIGYGECSEWKRELGSEYVWCGSMYFKYYANADQIKGLLEEAEKGYEWSKENCLWVCPSEKTCGYTCSHRGPHIFFPETEFRGCTTPRGQGGYTCPSCIPYRGEPKPGDTMKINGITHVYSEGSTGPDNGGDVIVPKEGDMKSEVPRNARGLEYRVVKHISEVTLSASDINAATFKHMVHVAFFRCDIGTIISPNGWWKVGDIDIASELLRLGYIEEIVHDPVVKVGDCFKHKDGNLYQLMPDDSDDIVLRCIFGVGIGKLFDTQFYFDSNTSFTNIKLSDFMEDWQVKEFTPCKIEIREVEE